VKYATSETECRSRMLVAYFGETKSENCDVCDVCLKRRRNELNDRQARDIEKLIFCVLTDGPFTITQIVGKAAMYKEMDVLAILRLLIEDGRVQSEGEIIRLPGI
jgi:ATP-dependent DNA helicase RecQ